MKHPNAHPLSSLALPVTAVPVTGLLLTGLLAAPAAAATAPAPAEPIELRAGVPGDEATLSMRRWHRRYRGLIRPVVRAWGELARATHQPRPGERMLTGCRDLGSALGTVDRAALLRAPDTAVAVHLDATLRSLASASRSCERGAYFLTTWRLRQAAGAWAELGARLELYGLGP